MRTRDRLTEGLVLALNALSAVTSGVGLWWIYEQHSSAIPVPGLSIGLAAASTILLQLLILRFWTWAADGRTFSWFIAASVPGLCASLTSGILAAGIYLAILNKSGLEAQETNDRAGTIIEPVARLGTKARSVAAEVEAIREETQRKADIESRVGGTCAGDTPRDGRGRIFRLRQRHAREAPQMAVLARTLSSRAIDIMQGLQADRSHEGMLRAFRAAHDLASHPDLNRIVAWLRQEGAGFGGGQFLDLDTNQRFACRDEDLHARMMRAAQLISDGFDLPAVPPRPQENIPLVDIIGKSYRDAFELAYMLSTGEFDPARYRSISYSVTGYVPALAVEIVIIILIFFRAQVNRARGSIIADDEIFGADQRNLPPSVRERNRRWINLILASLVEDRKGWFIARPIDGAPDIVAQWGRMALIRKLPTDPDLRPAIPIADIYPEWAASRASIHGGARWFALHPVSRDQLEWLRRAAADFEAEVGSEHAPTRPAPADDENVVDFHRAR